MILADTSAWVEYLRATGGAVDVRLTELIAAGDAVAVTEPIIMEVVAGAISGERESGLRQLLERFSLIPFEAAVDFDGAAWIYRRCRANRVTPRGMIDCMVAAVAWRSGSTLLAHDADLDRVAHIIGIEMDPASLRAKPKRPDRH